MRQGQNFKRSRGRSGGGGQRRQQNPKNMTYDSNGPDVRIRGTAQQVHEKYSTLARDAASAGDTIRAEALWQHAEHYFRILSAANDAGQANARGRGNDQDDDGKSTDDATGSEDNGKASGDSGQSGNSDDRNDAGDSGDSSDGSDNAGRRRRGRRRRREPSGEAGQDSNRDSTAQDEGGKAAASGRGKASASKEGGDDNTSAAGDDEKRSRVDADGLKRKPANNDDAEGVMKTLFPAASNE